MKKLNEISNFSKSISPQRHNIDSYANSPANCIELKSNNKLLSVNKKLKEINSAINKLQDNNNNELNDLNDSFHTTCADTV